MASKQKIVVNIINRNYPPGSGITGESACELASYLFGKGIHINIICTDAQYSKTNSNITPIGEVHRIKSFYNGKNKLFRLIANLYEGWMLMRINSKLNPTYTICLTDPPLLNMWASIYLGKKSKWILWAMDIFPNAFEAGKIISSRNFFYKRVNKIILQSPPDFLIALGKIQNDFLNEIYKQTIPSVLLPCGIFERSDMDNFEKMPIWYPDTNKIVVGYCGNLGEAHSIEFLFNIIEVLDFNKFQLVLSVYGTHARKLLDFAADKKGISKVHSIKQSELKFIDVHLASLKKEWINVCVPSKTVSSVCAGSSFLYYGYKESDNWNILKDAGWIIEPGMNDKNQIKDFFSKVSFDDINIKKKKAIEISTELCKNKLSAFENIYKAIVSD